MERGRRTIAAVAEPNPTESKLCSQLPCEHGIFKCANSSVLPSTPHESGYRVVQI